MRLKRIGILLLVLLGASHGIGSAQPADSPWPMFHRDTTHMGSIQCRASDKALLAWSYATGDALLSSPSIGINKGICVGSYDNNLYSLASNGALVWSYSTSDDIFSSPSIAYDGTMYIGSADSNVYAVSSDGSLLWSYSCSNEVNSSPTIGRKGHIYVGSNDEMLYAFVGQPTVTPTPTPTSTPPCRGCSPSPSDDGDDAITSLAMDDSWTGSPGTLMWSYFSGGVLSSPTIDEIASEVYTG